MRVNRASPIFSGDIFINDEPANLFNSDTPVASKKSLNNLFGENDESTHDSSNTSNSSALCSPKRFNLTVESQPSEGAKDNRNDQLMKDLDFLD